MLIVMCVKFNLWEFYFCMIITECFKSFDFDDFFWIMNKKYLKLLKCRFLSHLRQIYEESHG